MWREVGLCCIKPSQSLWILNICAVELATEVVCFADTPVLFKRVIPV